MRDKIKIIVSRLTHCKTEDCQGCKAYVDEICKLVEDDFQDRIKELREWVEAVSVSGTLNGDKDYYGHGEWIITESLLVKIDTLIGEQDGNHKDTTNNRL